MSKERRIGIGLVGAGAFVILCVCGLIYMHEAKALLYTIQFTDAKDLKTGDRVQLSGVDIGVVESVDLYTEPTRIDVKVKIDPKHAEKIRSDATAVIGGTGFPNVSGQKVVEIINTGAEPPLSPMPKGSIIKGMNSTLELTGWKIKNKLAGAKDSVLDGLDRAKTSLQETADQIRELKDNPEVQDAVGQLRAFVGKMRDKGKSAASQLAAEWPPIKAKIQPVLDKLAAMGKQYIVDQIKRIVSQVDSTLAAWRGGSATPAESATTSGTQTL